MSTFKNRILFGFFVSLSFFSASASEFSFPDSLHVQVWGGAQASDQNAAGIKGNESGILDAWVTHAFTDAVFCKVYIKGSPTYTTPFIEEASLDYMKNGFSAGFGLMSTHIGRAMYYKPFSIYNQFTRISVVWDSYGFGFDLSKDMGGVNVSGSATLNTRENAAAHVMLTIANNQTFCNKLIAGIQTGDIDYQDNFFVIGNDACISIQPFDIHCAVKYQEYQGFGIGNTTMKSGHDFELMTESRYRATQSLDICAMIYYQNFDKSFYYDLAQVGFDATYMVVPWIGMYGGYEYQNSLDIVSHVPELGVAITPNVKHSLIRLGVESTMTGNVHIDRLVGSLWFLF